jgi:hypothetical protein
MDTIHEYIDRTKSAVQKLYQATNSYYTLLLEPARPAFAYWGEYDERVRLEHEKWLQENKLVLEERAKRDNEFAAEIFAMATLSGAILQFAYMAIKLFSKNTQSHLRYIELIPNNHEVAKYCIGREIDEIPIGLIVYAGRNQAHHYDEKRYNKITEHVFHDLANWYSSTFQKSYIDDHYDLSNPRVINFATNILWKLDWQNYELYEKELLTLLK